MIPNVSLMRSDFAAIASLAYGAELGSIGASGTVRHVGMGGGGSAMVGRPSILVKSMLSWRKDKVLLSWLQRDADVAEHLACYEPCCDGAVVTETLADPSVGAQEITRHNFNVLSQLRADVVGSTNPRAKVSSLAGNAFFLNEWLRDVVPNVRAPKQIRQWADLGSGALD
jgi:hypothetical protein